MNVRYLLRPIPATPWILYCNTPVPLRFIDSGKPSEIRWNFSHQIYCANRNPDRYHTDQPLVEIKPQVWSTDLTAVAFDPKLMHFRNMQTGEETRDVPEDLPEYDPKLRRARMGAEERSIR